MNEDKIVLDRKSFEALAVDSRVRILKSLKQRRKTLTEMSEELGMSVSTVKEHLENLEGVGLILKKDDGHKWKYYELTQKGADIVAPKELRVWILLSMSLVVFAASLLALFYSLAPPMMAGAPEGGVQTAVSPPTTEPRLLATGSDKVVAGQENADIATAAKSPEASGLDSGGEANLAVTASSSVLQGHDLLVPSLIAAISGLTLLACLAILMRNRSKSATSP